MVSLWELIDKQTWGVIPEDHRLNLAQLHYKLNVVRAACPFPFVINDEANKARGYRTREQHYLLYEKINLKKKEQGLPLVRVPLESRHLCGLAADVADPAKQITKFVRENEPFIRGVGLWFEHPDATPSWLHFQIVPPQSLQMYFMP